MPTMPAPQPAEVRGHLDGPLLSPGGSGPRTARRWHWNMYCDALTNANYSPVSAATVMALICTQADRGCYPCPACSLNVVLDTLTVSGCGHHFVACSAGHPDRPPHCAMCAALTAYAATNGAPAAPIWDSVALLLPGALPPTHAVWVLDRMGLDAGSTDETVMATSTGSWAVAARLIAEGTRLHAALQAGAALHAGAVRTQ